MALDLRKNKDSIIKAYSTIVDKNSKTNWVIFGYEGLTPALKVISSGDGGIEEMADDLNSGKIMYAYCRLTDPNSGLPKYVLINWQGEGCQENFKLKCATHLPDITAFLKTVHVTINARTDVDVDENDILQKVAKASGANYGVHKEKPKPVEAPVPVGSNYKRVQPQRELSTQSRDAFWAEAEKEEKERQKQDALRAAEEAAKVEQERKDREAREAKERDRRMQERLKAVHEQRSMEKKSETVDKDVIKQKWEKEEMESLKAEEERRHQSEAMRKARAQEAQVLVSSGGTSNARAFFKQKSTEMPDAPQPAAQPGKLKSPFFSAAKEPEQLPPPRQAVSVPKKVPSVTESPPQSPPDRTPSLPPVYPSHEEEEVSNKPTRYSESEQQPHVRNLLSEGLPPRQDSEEEEEDQDWNEPEQQGPPNPYSTSPPATETYHTRDYGETEEPAEEESVPTGIDLAQGHNARALYDYQASDETEISFDPGDIITNVEQVDPGWWTGCAPDGHQGMFPANYVELI